MDKNRYLTNNQPVEAPEYIDGAKVLKWTWSGQNPFGYVGNEEKTEQEQVFGLAICQYEKNKSIYRFSCDADWETLQDAPYDSIDSAINYLPEQYKNQKITWYDK